MLDSKSTRRRRTLLAELARDWFFWACVFSVVLAASNLAFVLWLALSGALA